MAFCLSRFVDVVKTKIAGLVISLKWPKAEKSAPVQKISHVQGFAPWGWVIGSVVPVDDVNAGFLQKLLISGSVVFLNLVLLGGFIGDVVLHYRALSQNGTAGQTGSGPETILFGPYRCPTNDEITPPMPSMSFAAKLRAVTKNRRGCQ